jgi:hypothetical protein
LPEVIKEFEENLRTDAREVWDTRITGRRRIELQFIFASNDRFAPRKFRLQLGDRIRRFVEISLKARNERP